MLKYTLAHPQLLASIAAAGHGSQILLADANYPHSTGRSLTSMLVHLNLRPGMVTINDVLEPLLDAVPIESAQVMGTSDSSPVPAHDEYRRLLGGLVPVVAVERFKFYDSARGSDVAVVVATGDQRAYANLLLTVGVRLP